MSIAPEEAASVSTSRRKTVSRSRRGAASPGESPSLWDQRAQLFRMVTTVPALSLTHFQNAAALDATPGVLALAGPSLGLVVISTATAPPFPIVSHRDPVELGGTPDRVAVDPFAPHHKYVAASCTSGRVLVVSARPKYLFVEKHDLHPVAVTAMCWTMALHAPVEQVPWAEKFPSAPPTIPLATTTGRALISVDAAGHVVTLDPVSGLATRVFRLPPEACSGSFASTQSLVWTTVTAVAFRYCETQSASVADLYTSSSDDEQPCRDSVAPPTATPRTEEHVGVNVVLCNTAAVVVVRCRRSARGYRLTPVEWENEEEALPKATVVTLGKNAGSLRMSCNPWSSGLCLVSRPLHRFWLVDGASCRVMASHKLCLSSGAAFDETTWGAASFAAAEVSAPAWARSGVLRRHVVVTAPSKGADPSEASQNDGVDAGSKAPPLLQLGVLIQVGDDVAQWRVESNPWDTVPLPVEALASKAGDSHCAVLAACAVPDHGTVSSASSVPATPGVVFAPCCFVLAAGRLLMYLLPGDIAVTPLLEALLRERYGCPTVNRPSLPAFGDNATLPSTSSAVFADAMSYVARETMTAASTLWRKGSPPMTSPTSRGSFVGDLMRSVATRLGSESRQGTASPQSESPCETAANDGVAEAVAKPRRRQRAIVVYADPSTVLPESPLTPPMIPTAHPSSHLAGPVDEASHALFDAAELRESQRRDRAELESEHWHSRNALLAEEDRELSFTYGRFLSVTQRLEDAAAAVKRVNTSREAAALRWATYQERGRSLRPISDILRELIANPSSSCERHFAKTALAARQASDDQVDIVGQSAPSARIKAWASLLDLQERDRKLFDLAEVRMAHAAKEAELAATAISDFVVYEEWRRVSTDDDDDSAWRPCRVQYTLASNGTAVDLEALLHADDESWVEPAFRVSQWKFAKRWPANEVEDQDPSFWYDHAAAIGEGAHAKLPDDLKVRRRVWMRRQRSAAVEQKVRDLKAKHQLEYLQRERALLGTPLPTV